MLDSVLGLRLLTERERERKRERERARAREREREWERGWERERERERETGGTQRTGTLHIHIQDWQLASLLYLFTESG